MKDWVPPSLDICPWVAGLSKWLKVIYLRKCQTIGNTPGLRASMDTSDSNRKSVSGYNFWGLFLTVVSAWVVLIIGTHSTWLATSLKKPKEHACCQRQLIMRENEPWHTFGKFPYNCSSYFYTCRGEDIVPSHSRNSVEGRAWSHSIVC